MSVLGGGLDRRRARRGRGAAGALAAGARHRVSRALGGVLGAADGALGHHRLGRARRAHRRALRALRHHLPRRDAPDQRRDLRRGGVDADRASPPSWSTSSAPSRCGGSTSTSARSGRARMIEHADDPGRVARIAFTYAHIPIIAGIVVSAVAAELVIAHPEGHVDARRGRLDPRRAGAVSRRQPLVQEADLALAAAVAPRRARAAGGRGRRMPRLSPLRAVGASRSASWCWSRSGSGCRSAARCARPAARRPDGDASSRCSTASCWPRAGGW